MEEKYEISVKEVIDVASKYLLLVVVLAVIGAGAGFFVDSQFTDPEYDSTLTLYVTADSGGEMLRLDNLNASQKLVSTYIEILKSESLLNKVYSTIDGRMTVEEIRKSIDAHSLKDTEIIEVTVTTNDPETSWLIAGKLSTAGPAEILRVVKAGDVQVIDKPIQTDKPTVEHGIKFTVLGLIGGLLIGLVIMFIREVIVNKVRSKTELERKIDLPVLGVIPDIVEVSKKGV